MIHTASAVNCVNWAPESRRLIKETIFLTQLSTSDYVPSLGQEAGGVHEVFSSIVGCKISLVHCFTLFNRFGRAELKQHDLILP